jgi:predicted ATPase
MRLKNLKIKNFRGLKDIEFDLDTAVSVIVGPNAIGKSSILEAIRLHKAILSPTHLNEAIEVLQAMGAFSPHTQTVMMEAIFGDPKLPLEIRLSLEIEDKELSALENSLPQLALSHLRNSLALAPGQQDIALTQYLSSPAAQQRLAEITTEMQKNIQNLRGSKRIVSTLLGDPIQKMLRGGDLFAQEAVTALMSTVPFTHTLMNYFPADRVMPTGEVALQIGSPDAALQMRSHIANPATKYTRLKQYLVNQSMRGKEAREELEADFDLVFSKLLPGKSLAALRLTPQGLLSVAIQDHSTKSVYDIDYMSSGEKGLLCTFFLMRRTTAAGGIVLLDEPELHLNPKVCERILPFLIDEVVEKVPVQAIVCTHSPEILAFAYENAKCRLFHLRTGDNLSPIYSHDKREAYEALRLLGAPTADILFSRGSVFVEGTDDTELLQSGFPDRLSGFKISELHGRNEVEKNIRSLQDAEQKGEVDTLQCFIFDRDRMPTGLMSSKYVRVLQWQRYCFENYLLDHDSIYDVCQNKDVKVGGPSFTRAELRKTLKDLAFDQLTGMIARSISQQLAIETAGLRASEADDASSYEEAAEMLAARLQRIRAAVEAIKMPSWKQDFINECNELDARSREEWEDKWTTECNGKIVLESLHKILKTNLSALAFKRHIIEAMARKAAENWRAVDSLLSETLKQ